MNRILFFVALVTFGFISFAQQAGYQVEIDLTTQKDDKVPVTIIPPASANTSVEFHMAKVVPGTYSISDFGRFVTEFTATDLAGNPLTVTAVETNKWKIETGGKPYKISYWVNDTFDSFDSYKKKEDNIIFEPGGTSIENDVFVMNTFGFIGYIDGQKSFPYELKIKHDESLYGATALKRTTSTKTEDTFSAEDFNFLADGPIMYSRPDTITKKLANANVLVSVYSPNAVLTAKDIMDNISDLMEAQSEFLGGELPVDRYAFLVYLVDEPTISGAWGALEHSYSSLYSLPEAAADRIGQMVRNVAAHEFFHIVTPLNIHADQIGNFDYINPKMSEHLWLYEGVTEYNSMLVQVKHGLFGLDAFLNEIKEKLMTADGYPKGVSFTEMSRRILEPEFEPMYTNVYYKGALIGMCLDLHLLKYSNGQYNLQKLLGDLSIRFGKSTSFKDEELFGVIEELGGKESADFLRRYVAGTEELPIPEVLSWAGIDYIEAVASKEITMGSIGMNLNEDGKIFIQDVSEMNSFGKAMGYKEGDVIRKVNGQEFTIQTGRQIMEDFSKNTKAGDLVTVEIERANKKGKVKTKVLEAKAEEISKDDRHVLSMSSVATPDQIKMLSAWTMAK